MKTYVAAFLIACSITSLAKADIETTYIYGDEGITTIYTIGRSTYITSPNGSSSTIIARAKY